jgi:hypothetical protein
MTQAKRHKANPQFATKGAAVRRAKAALGDAIDERLAIDLEEMEFALLAKVLGCKPTQVKGRLKGATLGELEEWKRLVLSAGC